MDRFSNATLLLATAALSACASSGDFPSLAPRAIERDLAGGMTPAPCLGSEPAAGARPSQPATPLPSDAGLLARVRDLVAAARSGQSEFEAALPRARTAVSGAGASGSDSWLEAQQELSRLEAARRRTVEASSELDALGVNRSNIATAAGDQQAIAQGEAEVRGLADAQEAELDRLSGQLGTPG